MIMNALNKSALSLSRRFGYTPVFSETLKTFLPYETDSTRMVYVHDGPG
jgi:hypothetical protein